MTPDIFLVNAIIPAMRLLPDQMDSPEARAMLIAIALQESRLEHRRQINGPARGYFQFECGGGVRGVLTHPATSSYVASALSELDYDSPYTPVQCHEAIEHNDILACVFARLLLWTLPDALPAQNAAGKAWSEYVAAWRPGKPRRESWDMCYLQAWEIV